MKFFRFFSVIVLNVSNVLRAEIVLKHNCFLKFGSSGQDCLRVNRLFSCTDCFFYFSLYVLSVLMNQFQSNELFFFFFQLFLSESVVFDHRITILFVRSQNESCHGIHGCQDATIWQYLAMARC